MSGAGACGEVADLVDDGAGEDGAGAGEHAGLAFGGVLDEVAALTEEEVGVVVEDVFGAFAVGDVGDGLTVAAAGVGGGPDEPGPVPGTAGGRLLDRRLADEFARIASRWYLSATPGRFP
ncbi:hypothetical protein [Streptomyces fagopyri]|uniref:hypothetical protein n=1 Tax=Streptomyces fagopyri TaxID=2662397 RepID=UPI0037F8076F